MKVLWLTFIPSPYRVSFFEELGKHCDLTVLYERETSSYRKKWDWKKEEPDNYKSVFLKGITVFKNDKLCLGIKPYLLDKSYDIIVLSNPTSPTGIYAARVLKKDKIDYIVESDGAFPSRKKGLRLLLKKYVMKSALKCFSTAKLHDEYYMQCGVKQENIVRYPFTSIYNKDVKSVLCADEKKVLREKLGIKEEKVLLSVGQFIYRKGFDLLINALSKNSSQKIGCYIVGGNPTSEYIELLEKSGAKNIHFIGFKKPEELQEYYQAADVFVLPTREDIWGLVINEAMAYGLPVISTDKCIAALELVKDGENGCIVPVDDIESLRGAINKLLLLDEESLTKMGERSLEIVSGYTFENMVKVHLQVFDEIIKNRQENVEKD